MQEQIKARLGDQFYEMAMDMVHNAEEQIVVHASAIVNEHNMTDTKFGRMTPRSLRQQIEDFEQSSGDDAELLMRECVSDIENAMDTFVTQFSEYIVHIIGPSAR